MKKRYDNKIKELETKIKNSDAVFLENDKLRREIQELKKTEKALIQVRNFESTKLAGKRTSN